MKTPVLNVYAVFHLNLAYSSIEEEHRAEVIEKCYRPLTRLAGRHSLPIAIEATGYTLEAVSNLDPEWIEELRRLADEGVCEFVGSGYAQIIGPLVPAQVNAANLRIGNKIYRDLLGIQPRIALINEQTYSAGLIGHYVDAGYDAIVMEWDNPYSFHSEWDSEWRYLPQVACGQHGEEISLLWNKSIAFQKFQRYAHGEIELEEYLKYLASHVSADPRAMSLYGNDVEVFDYRPGRYHTEAVLPDECEWKRIGDLFEAVIADGRFKLVLPSEALEMMSLPGAGNRLSLESPECPIPVKKQGKYNITRWAVTGRDDLGINTVCRRIYDSMKRRAEPSDEEWKELCRLWSSDFRTHITEKRWAGYIENLKTFSHEPDVPQVPKHENPKRAVCVNDDGAKIRRTGRFLEIDMEHVSLTLNCAKGLAVKSLCFRDSGDCPQVVTLPHGYFDDISMGADWYSGHMVHEAPGRSKVTDLGPVEPEILHRNGAVTVQGAVDTALGTVRKTVAVHSDEPALTYEYSLDSRDLLAGSLRLGHITVNPGAFDAGTLFFRTCNGGSDPDTFLLKGRKVQHGAPVSHLVSASSGVGITDGWLEFGDGETVMRAEVDMSLSAALGLVTYVELGPAVFFRISFSACEMDETRRGPGSVLDPFGFRVKLRLIS